MAGIDAPETAHAGRAAMPFADTATVALQSMLNNGDNIELLIDPKNKPMVDQSVCLLTELT